jgi:ubiquinone/menaquinone biosynthesis C-methylase UbiE
LWGEAIVMDTQLQKWNETFHSYGDRKPKYDDWLDKFEHLLSLSADTPIIDLGCGSGNDTLYLKEKGYDVISCDFSIEALNRVKLYVANPDTRLFNMQEGLPFEDNTAKAVVADLSLHYFCSEDTKKIISDISRVLVKNGHLICRLNSVKDFNYGAGQGEKIEENYYNIDGKLKRFFDMLQISDFFNEWEIEYANECEMHRYKETKIVWEVAVKNARK